MKDLIAKTFIYTIVIPVGVVLTLLGNYLKFSGEWLELQARLFPRSTVFMIVFNLTLTHYWDFYWTLYIIGAVLGFLHCLFTGVLTEEE